MTVQLFSAPALNTFDDVDCYLKVLMLTIVNADVGAEETVFNVTQNQCSLET